MTFVNEFIPNDKKSSFSPEIFYNPNTGDRRNPIELYRWTIDYDKNIFLIRLGGGGPWEGGSAPKPREHMALSWNGHVVKFEALGEATGSIRNNDLIINWKVSNIRMPECLEIHHTAVEYLIRESMDAMGSSTCDREGIKAVNIEFDRQPS